MTDDLRTFMNSVHHHIGTVSAEKSSSGQSILQTYSDQELRRASAIPACELIIHHGDGGLVPEFVGAHIYDTALPVFIAGDIGVDNLSKDRFGEITAGHVRNWRELGGEDLPIKLYHHGGQPNEKVLHAILAYNKLPVPKNSQPASNYRHLAELGIGSKGGVMLGLRSPIVKNEPIREMKINGSSFATNGETTHAIRIPIHFYMRGSSDNAIGVSRDTFRSISERAQQDSAADMASAVSRYFHSRHQMLHGFAVRDSSNGQT